MGQPYGFAAGSGTTGLTMDLVSVDAGPVFVGLLMLGFTGFFALNLMRLNQILELNTADGVAVVQPGVITATIKSVRFLYLIPAAAVAIRTPRMTGIST